MEEFSYNNSGTSNNLGFLFNEVDPKKLLHKKMTIQKFLEICGYDFSKTESMWDNK
jgi:hypothetical protein